MIGDDELNARLRSADRTHEGADHGDALHALFNDSREGRIKPSRWRRALLGAGIVGAIALGTGVAVPVAATVARQFLAQNVPEMTDFGGEAIPDSEYVDPAQADIDAYIASVYPDDLPLPSGYTSEMLQAKVSSIYNAMEGITQEVTFRRSYEMVAYCGWVDQWLDANATNDQAGSGEAAAMMLAAADWAALNATDGGTSDGSTIMDTFRTVAASARAGDRQAVQSHSDLNECDFLRVSK